MPNSVGNFNHFSPELSIGYYPISRQQILPPVLLIQWAFQRMVKMEITCSKPSPMHPKPAPEQSYPPKCLPMWR